MKNLYTTTYYGGKYHHMYATITMTNKFYARKHS